MSIIVENMAISVEVQNLFIGDIEIVVSKVGKLDVSDLKYYLNNAFYWGLPFFNELIADLAIVVPSELFGIFDLSDLTLTYFDHYIQMGSTPTFKPLRNQYKVETEQ